MKTISAIISMGFTMFAYAQTSKDTPRLQEALERYPEADADGDGVLTMEEAKAFREKADKPGRKNSGGKKKGRPADESVSQIYKTVGKDKLELYVSAPKGHKADAKVPAIVLFHGGGFSKGSPDSFLQHAEYLSNRGMVAIRVRYRLTSTPGVEVTDCIEDAISAMRWVRANAGKLGVDPDRIAAGGGSAGGYLSGATLMIDFINAKTDPPNVSAKPNALVLFSSAFGGHDKDGSPDPRNTDGKGILKNYIKPDQPPMMNFFGTEDPLYPVARDFMEAYRKAGNSCELVTYEGAPHSFFMHGKYPDLTLDETDKFLTGLGWLEKK